MRKRDEDEERRNVIEQGAVARERMKQAADALERGESVADVKRFFKPIPGAPKYRPRQFPYNPKGGAS